MPTLTDTDRAQVNRIVRARARLLDFAAYTFPNYDRGPHLKLVAEELEAIEAGRNQHLIIEMPPRHGKTQLVSVRFPAWAICKKPTRRIIAASHGERLAGAIGRTVRNLVNTQPLFPKVRLAPDLKAKDQWETMQGGQFLAVGVGSGVVGFGGDIITVDDPIRKRSEAESEVFRDNNHEWWTSEIVTRGERDTAYIIVMHRWHEDDLAGRVLLEEGDQAEGGMWKVIRLPAIAEEGDLMKRAPGEALWPYRRTKEELAILRKKVGERNWNSLFQQRPAPPEGAVFKWWKRYDTLPQLRQIVVGIDTAYTGSATSDYTAWSTWGFDGSYAYLMEADRYQGEVPDAERRITATIWRLIQQNPGIPVKGLVRASVAIDRVAAQHLRRGVATTPVNGGKAQRAGLPIVEVKLPAMGGKNVKEELGNIYATEFESQRALIPTYAPWLEAWLEEHKAFPAGLHDDFVETTFLAMHYLFRREPVTLSREPVKVYGDY